MKIATLSIAAITIAFNTTVSAQEESQNVVTPVTTNYTCDQADTLKFNKEEYKKLDGTSRVIVDAQWQQCQIQAESKTEEQVVIIVNPAPSSENDRVFYGILKKKQLEEAHKACAQGGQIAGALLEIIGTATGTPAASEIGAAAFEYSDVSCSSVANQIKSGNVLAAVMPSMIVNHAVINKITKDTVSNIPLLSSADKKNLKKVIDSSTQPPSVQVTKKHVIVKAGPVKVSFPKKCCKF